MASPEPQARGPGGRPGPLLLLLRRVRCASFVSRLDLPFAANHSVLIPLSSSSHFLFISSAHALSIYILLAFPTLYLYPPPTLFLFISFWLFPLSIYILLAPPLLFLFIAYPSTCRSLANNSKSYTSSSNTYEPSSHATGHSEFSAPGHIDPSDAIQLVRLALIGCFDGFLEHYLPMSTCRPVGLCSGRGPGGKWLAVRSSRD